MTVLAGGVWCDGAFDRRMQCDSPGSGVYALNPWLRLVPDPLGRPYHVLRAWISHGDYVRAPSSSTKRAETQVQAAVCSWGTTYVHHWRMLVPPDWINYGASSYCVPMQVHDVNAPGINRRPTLAAEIVDNVLRWNASFDSIPSGQDLYSRAIAPGQELEFTLRARWTDGVHDADANGVFELYEGDTLVYRSNGTRNTWLDGSPTDANPPYLKAGIYQPNNADAWWQGRQIAMCHVASLTATEDETPASLRAYVDARLAANSNAPRPPYVPPGM